MATDTTQGGLFMTPEMYQQAQQQAALSRGIELAQLDPLAAAKAQLYAGGYQAAGALGGQDPVLQRQVARRNLLQQIDISNPNSLVQGIRASTQDPELSAYLLGKYKELTGIQKEQSVISKNQAWEAAKTDSEKKRNLLSDVEQSLTEGKEVDPKILNQARLAWAQETKPKTFQDPTTGTIQTVPGVDVNLFPSIGKLIGGAGTGKAGVIATAASEKIAAKEEQAQEDTLASLKNGLTNIDKARGLSKDWTTNPWISATTENLPTSAMALKDTVTSLNSQKTIDLIKRMKEQSKTGATGFGSVTEKELDLLQSDIVKLNYRSPTFKADLKRVEDTWKDIINKIETEKAKKSSGGVNDLDRASADVAGLQRQLSTLSANDPRRSVLQQELTKSQERVKYENRIKKAGDANKGMSRADLISNLQKNNALPADYR